MQNLFFKVTLTSITIPNIIFLKNSSWNIETIDVCDSTNSQVKLLKANKTLTDRTTLMTYLQRKGRGQGDNSWYSSRKKNLLASFYLEVELPVVNHFMLTIMASIALYRMLKSRGINCDIKWPNDIYYENKKIAGVLIENTLMRDKITETIIGIGLNVNETEFPESIPNPCSMKQIIGKDFKLDRICKDITKELDVLLQQLGSMPEELFHEYQSLLYRLNQWYLFKIKGKTINARIHGVELDGRLILETDGGTLMHLLFGEIEYII